MPRAKVEPPIDALITREEVAELLHISVTQVRRIEGKELFPLVHEGTHFFQPEQVLQYRDRHQDGERDARIFEAFERGLSPARTVIELRMDAATVQALHKVWLAMTDSVVFSPPEGVSRREWERTWGVAVTARNVAKALQIVAAHPELRQCLEPRNTEGHERTALAVGT